MNSCVDPASPEPKMGPTPIVIVKSFEQRLKELQTVLRPDGTSKEVLEDWRSYAEFVVEPVAWQAVWKIPKDFCDEFKIASSTTVLVSVENVSIKELAADVCITGVEDDIHLPEKIVGVPLIQLYPTVEQQYETLEVLATASFIDNLRLFFKHLWYPWDIDNDENNWVESHLENRLQLQYQLMGKKIFHETATEIQKLIDSGKHVYEKIEELQAELPENYEDCCNKPDSRPELPAILTMIQLQHKLDVIKNQLLIYENPAMRNLLVHGKREKLLQERGEFRDAITLVWLEGEIDNAIECLNFVKRCVPENSRIRIQSDFQHVLDKLLPGDKILLSPGTHNITGSSGLEGGGFIQGLNSNGNVIISSKDCWSLLDLYGDEVTVNNVTLNVSSTKHIVVIRRGVCHLNNVVFNKAESAVGVVVFSGATLYASNCTFESLETSIHGDKGSNIVLTDCIFKNNQIAVEVHSPCQVKMESCSIDGSKKYGICVLQTDQPQNKGGLQLLNKFPSFVMANVLVNENACDVVLMNTYIEL